METNIIMDPSTIANPQPSRKRNRENETPSQRIKREKAAERQRRKRERDRLGIPVNYAHPRNPVNRDPSMNHQPAPPPAPSAIQPTPQEPELTPEEEARRDRVRAAARDRQRKHRALVKQKKMRELGMDMGNDVSGAGPSDELYGDPQAGFHATMISPPASGVGLGDDPNDPSFPPAQGHGGQMFATTLLLSFSCAPLLKQHLLHSLQMSNDELASLEPIIAEAWDQWDRQRRQQQQPFDATQQYTTQHAFAPNPPGSASSADVPASTSAANEFRARFHRSLVVPTPFQAQAAAAQAQANAAATQSAVMSGITQEEGGSAGPKPDPN